MERDTLSQTDVSAQLPTFDQIVATSGGDIEGIDLGPNARIKGEIVIEPVSGGQMVSVRSDSHVSLISFIVGKTSYDSVTQQAAVLTPMRRVIASRFSGAEKVSMLDRKIALQAMAEFETSVLGSVRDSIDTKGDSEAVRIRAAAVVEALKDARRIIMDAMLFARGATTASDGDGRLSSRADSSVQGLLDV